MAFLGLNIDKSKKYTQTIQVPMKLTGCSLRSFAKGRTTLKVTVDNQTFVLGHLTTDRTEQIELASIFEIGEVVTFECDGPNDISLVGELLLEDMEDLDELDEDYQYTMAESDNSESISEEDVGAKIVELDEEKPSEKQDKVMPEAEDAGSEDEIDEKQFEELMDEIKKWKGSDDVNEEDIAEYLATIEDEESSNEEAAAEDYKELLEAVQKATGKKNVADEDIQNYLDQLSEGSSMDEAEDVVEEFKQPSKRKQPEQVAPTKKTKKEETAKKEVKSKEEINKKGETVTKEGIVVKEMNVQNGYKCKSGDKVSVRYLGRLTTGKTFDSNMKGKPFNFTIGKGEVIRGWDLGIVGMTEGSTRKLTIPANLAYGKKGSPPEIPGNSTLVFDVKMLKITKSKK
eukprot:NODE_1174_length_1904_cov_0.962881.p1 type:complete len:400 gc:universal NODE_1174_length_1904_cov_0.962881:1847-648(-)